MTPPNRPMPRGEKKPNFVSGEILACLLICIISALSLLRVMSASSDHSPTVYNIPVNTPKKSEPFPIKTVIPAEKVQNMRITGYREANEKLTFHIPDFHGKIVYELELGNGKTLTVTDPKIRYAYPSDGEYKINLWGTCKGKRKLLCSDRIKIEEAIEVSDNAFMEVDG